MDLCRVSLRKIVSEIGCQREVKGKLTSAFRACSHLTFRGRNPNRVSLQMCRPLLRTLRLRSNDPDRLIHRTGVFNAAVALECFSCELLPGSPRLLLAKARHNMLRFDVWKRRVQVYCAELSVSDSGTWESLFGHTVSLLTISEFFLLTSLIDDRKKILYRVGF